MANEKCARCPNKLVTCQGCKGRGRTQMTTCSKCNNTGWVCPTHHGNWQ